MDDLYGVPHVVTQVCADDSAWHSARALHMTLPMVVPVVLRMIQSIVLRMALTFRQFVMNVPECRRHTSLFPHVSHDTSPDLRF